MISNPKNGWCNFKLGDFEGTPSYLTDVPVDLLAVFIDYHKSGYGIAYFDEEGNDFYLLITGYSVYIIGENGYTSFYDFKGISVKDLESEAINDIKSDLEGWSKFSCENDVEEIKIHRDEIWNKLCTLEKLRGGGV